MRYPERRSELSYVSLAKLAVSLAIVALATASAAGEVRFPLTVDYEILRGAIRKHLHEQPGGELELWRTADGCGSFVLRQPSVEPADGRLKISGPASASAGISLLGLCWASVSWDGFAEILARPEIGRDWQLRLRDLDMQLYDSARQQGGVASRVWTVVKGWAEAELSTFTFDLGPPVAELKTLLGSFAGSGGSGLLTAALQTLRPVGLAVESEAVKLVVAIDLPPTAAAPRAPEPALTPAQLKR